MSEVAELIERLRKGKIAYLSDGGPVYCGGDDLHTEAADALATLTARVTELERERDEAVFLLDEGGQAYRAISDLEVKLAKAVEALRPFAKEAEEWGNLWDDDFVPVLTPRVTDEGDNEKASFTVGDFRRARAVLSELEG